MNIMVRIINEGRGEIKNLQGQIAGLETQIRKADIATNNWGRNMGRVPLSKWGKDMQWTGRQIEYNFTIPLAIAGGAALKWEMDNEKAVTRISKVYGDASTGTQQFAKDQKDLRIAFEALSNIFGVTQSAVLNVAADWAAAGAVGTGLAKATRLTLEAMILGEMDAAAATTALISIQAQYGLKLDDTKHSAMTLHGVMAVLNMTENQTAITMQGLIDAFQRSAGAARTAGIDARTLAALLAALVPASGSATTAGNGLRTMLSRLLAPTKQSVDTLRALGIEVNEAGWQSKTGAERLTELAKTFEGLTHGQQAIVSSTIASRFQINRFDVLMRAVVDPTSAYARALKSTADQSKNLAQYQRELGQVLASNPQAFKIMMTQLQNAMARIIVPLLPAILAVADSIVHLVQKFQDLPPPVQKLILLTLLFVAVVGPLLRYVGAAALLLGKLGSAFLWVGRFAIGSAGHIRILLTAMSWPFTALASGFEFVGKGVGRMFGHIAEASAGILGRFRAVFAGLGRLILGAFAGIGTGMLTVFRGIFTAPLALMGSIWSGIARLPMLAFGFFRNGLGKIGESFVGWGKSLLGFAWKIIPAIFGGPWKLAIAGAVALIVAFRSDIANIFRSIGDFIIKVFNMLPESVKNAMIAVWNVIKSAAEAIGRALSHLNPFAKHSPSLVENVQKGTQQIGDHYAKVSDAVVNATTPIKQRDTRNLTAKTYGEDPTTAYVAPQATSAAAQANAAKTAVKAAPEKDHVYKIPKIVQPGLRVIEEGADKALQAFNLAIKPALLAQEVKGFSDMRKEILYLQKDAGPAVDRLVASILKMEVKLPGLAAQVAKQQGVVDGWKEKLDKATTALQKATEKLDDLKRVAQQAQTVLDANKKILDDLANTPIAGMKAMTDAIFANSMEQKRLQLEIYKTEDAFGTLDDIKGKYAAIQGEIEKLRGEQNDLRAAGAGSDILKTYDDQISALQSQQKAMKGTTDTLSDLQKQLDKLKRSGDELDLQKSLAFDPLTKQIDDFVHAAKELPFDQIMTGLQAIKPIVEANQLAFDNATKAVADQQVVVDGLSDTRDRMQKSYDIESAKLTDLKNKYDAAKTSIDNMKQALNDFASASQSAKSKSTAAADALAGAGLGDFKDPGGKGSLTDPGNLQDLAKKWAEEAKRAFGNFDLFKPIRQKWDEGWAWLNKHTGGYFEKFATFVKDHFKALIAGALTGLAFGPLGAIIGAGIGLAFGSINMKDLGKKLAGVFSGIGDALSHTPIPGIVSGIAGAFSQLGKAIQGAWHIIGPTIESMGKFIGHTLFNLISTVVEHLKKWGDIFKPLIEALGHVFNIIKFAFKVIAGIVAVGIAAVLHVWKIVWAAIGPILRPIFDGIVTMVGVAMDIIHGVVKFVLDLINGDFGKAFKDIWEVIKSTWEAIYTIFSTVINTISGIVQGFVDYMVSVWQTAWVVLEPIVNALATALSTVFQAIGQALEWVWNNIIKPVWDSFATAWETILMHPMEVLVGAFKEVWHAIGSSLEWVKDHMITPVWNNLKAIWTDFLKPAMDGLVASFSVVWHAIGDELKWVYDHTIKPVWDTLVKIWDDVLKPGMQGLVNGMYAVFNGIGHGITSGIDFGIDVINTLIGGLNWIGKHIPGLSFHIDDIGKLNWQDYAPPKLAIGGVIDSIEVGAGFKTRGARAIVGEGNPVHPEYVIPTDPQHRGNALSLLDRLLGDLHRTRGSVGTPATSGTAGHHVGGVPAYFLGGILGDIADGIWGGIQKGFHYLREGVITAAFAPFLLTANQIIGQMPNGMHERDWMNAEKNRIYDWAKGTGHKHKGEDLSKMGGAVGAAALAALNAGGGGKPPKAIEMGGLIPSLAEGAIIRRRAGGTLVRVGEGGTDEAVVPLPNGGVKTETHVHTHNYRDLVFPNVKTAADAEEFLKNLKSLTEKAA